jgi:diguanylate cyclase (GGDEF)-like protein
MSVEPSSGSRVEVGDASSGANESGAIAPGSDGSGFAAEFAHIDSAHERDLWTNAHGLTEDFARAIDGASSPILEARILLRRARGHLARSEFRRARDSARCAASVLGIAAGAWATEEVDAHALRARAASMLGCSVEAVGAALLSVRLAESLEPGPWTVRAQLALGVAYAWGAAPVQASKALETATYTAARHGDATLRFEAAIERQWAVVLGAPTLPSGQRHLARSDGVDALCKAWDECASVGGEATGATGDVQMLAFSAGVAGALTCLWAGESARAMDLRSRAEPVANAHAVQGWLLAAQSWWEGEWAVREGARLEAAAMHADRMTKWATDLGHLPLVCQGHGLAAHVHVVSGEWRSALERLAALRTVEHRMLAQQLETCEEGVADRVAARESERSLSRLQAESTTYWQWAHEDALTGIANLRRFNQCLDAWSAESQDAGRALSVAIIDVDRFKAINDNISHDAGDMVLKGIAMEMQAHVREQDLPARWGGDEFAILFRDADEAKARQVAQRIQDAVRQRDWREVAKDLQVFISVGVVQAGPGETKRDLRARADRAMYEQKRARQRDELARLVPPVLVRRIARTLRRASRVVIFVGSSTAERTVGTMADNLGSYGEEARAAYGHVDGLKSHPELFMAFWAKWRDQHRRQEPQPLHKSLASLTNVLPQATIVTERTDGLLAKAGAVDVVELYGNVFHNRCHACGRVRPNIEGGRCMACQHPEPSIRPNIVLLGEHVEPTLLANTKHLFRRADVVLVVDSDLRTYPGAGLVEMAAARDAEVFILGGVGPATHGSEYHSIHNNPALTIDAVVDALQANLPADGISADLTDAGVEALCFLSGSGADHRGTTLEQVLQWSDVQLAVRLDVQPWLFPLATRSRVNPSAPQPTLADFEVLAKDEQVREGMQRAFQRMLRHYGFVWRDGTVLRGPDWRSGFAIWALNSSAHDLFISRILGALTLCGLRSEALAFLDALGPEVKRFRGEQSAIPLYHWNLAVSAS